MSDLFCATERSNNIADSKFGVLSFSASKPSADCISSDSTACGRSPIDFNSTHSTAAAAAKAILSEGGGDPHASSTYRQRLSANQLLPQQAGSSSSSSLLPPLINIFTPITSFPLQLLSAAATPVVGGNFNCAARTVGASVEATNNFSLNNPCNPTPLNSLYPCNENLLCHQFTKEAIECSRNKINNNNCSGQQTIQFSKPLHQQVSSSHTGSKSDSQSFMSSRGRRPANTQTTSNNQSDKANASKVRAESTSANKRTKRTAFSKQRLRHNRLISESSSSSSSESETQSSIDTDLSSGAVSKSLRSLRKRSRGCTPVSTTQKTAQPAASYTTNTSKTSKTSQPTSSSSTVIGSSISSRLRPRTSTARPAVDSSADRLSPATTNSSAPHSRNRSPLSQNLSFDITEIGEATLVFGNRVDTPESPENCQISEEYYQRFVDSAAEDQRLPKVPTGGKNSKKRKQKMKQNANNEFSETRDEAAPIGFNTSSVAGRLRSKKKSSKQSANSSAPSNAAYSGVNSAGATTGGESCPNVIQNNSKLAPPQMSQSIMPLMWPHPGVNATAGSNYDESQLIVNPALQNFRDIPNVGQPMMSAQSSVLPSTNLNAVLPMNFAAPTSNLMAQLPPQFWGSTTATPSNNMGMHTSVSATANPLGAGLHPDPTFASFLPNPQISNPNLLPVDSSLLNSYSHPISHFGHSSHQLARMNLALTPNVQHSSNQMPPSSASAAAAATLSNHSSSSSSNNQFFQSFSSKLQLPAWFFGSASGRSNSSSGGHGGSKRSRHSNASCHANNQSNQSSAARRWGSNANNSNVNTTTVASSNASNMGNGPSMSGRKGHSSRGGGAASMGGSAGTVAATSTVSSASPHHSSDVSGALNSNSAAQAQSSTVVSSASGTSTTANALFNTNAAFAAGIESSNAGAPTSAADNPTLSSILIGSGSQNDDQSEITQLQALLESRGLPPQLFSAIGPRVSHLISRSLSSNSTVTKAQQLLEGLQSADESVQLQAAIEMCQLLVMGNEDTLAGFPTKQVVPALATLLKTGHNYDMMNHACRALTYMMEALPRSTSVVVDAVPALLEKVESIQCMDVAEQSLTALEMLSKRHHKVLLNAGALPACLLYIEFFSIPAQRSALTIAANCCLSVTATELEKVSTNIPVLTEKLTSVTDKRSIENVVLCFSRMVDNCQSCKEKLTEIAGHGLLENLQQLLVVTPPVLSANSVGTVVRMMSLMASENSCLAVQLLHSGIQSTITYLLLGPQASQNLHSEVSSDRAKNVSALAEIEIMPKNSQELLEITCLIHDLMPSLPSLKGNLFEIDELLWNNSFSSGRFGAIDDKSGGGSGAANQAGSSFQWMWKDGRSGTWQPYAKMDNRMIEMAFSSGEEEITLSGLSSLNLSATYTIDFHAMQQINDETGTVRSVTRSFKANQTKDKGKNKERKDVSEPMDLTSNSDTETDARITAFQDDALCSSFIKSLFGCLYEIYSSSAGQQVKHKTLRSILRMLHMASPEVLRTVLAGFSVSSHIAHMLSSNDQKVVVCAIQMSYILIEKLPDVFTVYFKREGVMHQMQKLTQLNVKMEILNTAVNSSTGGAGTEIKQGMEVPSSTECDNLATSLMTTSATVSERCATHLAALENRASLSVMNAESYLSLSNESIHSNAFDDGSVPGVASAVTVNSYNEDSSPTLDADIVTSKDFGLGSKKKKPPPIPVAAPPSSSKRSRRAKSESAQTPDSPTVMGVNSPPHGNSILSRAIFGASGTPFRMNSVNASSNAGQAGISIGANYSFSHATSTSSSTAGSSSFPTQPIPVPSTNKDSSSLVPPTTVSTKPGPSSSSGGASGFFASLKPIRWPSSTKSCSSSHLEKMLATQTSSGGGLNESSKRDKKKMSAPSVVSNAASINREKIKLWIKEKAVLFLELYSSPTATSNLSATMLATSNTGNNSASISDTLSKLTNASQNLNVKSNPVSSIFYPSNAKHSSKRSMNVHVAVNEDLNNKSEQYVETLRAIAQLLQEGDASPFEVLHSGLVTSLNEFLTCETVDASISRDKRLRLFCHVFLNCPKSENEPMFGAENSSDSLKDRDEPMVLEKNDNTLLNLGPFASPRTCALKALVAKLILCLHQLEQFSVRITDLESITGGSGAAAAALAALGSSVSPSSRSGSAAIKFFNTHQLKCQLQRHPNCKGARQWKGGPVKIDPLAQMHAVEKFLVAKGLARDDGREEDYDSEDEIRDPFFAMLGSLAGNTGSHHSRHRLKLFIGQQEIPYDWTVYQAIRQHGSTSKNSPPTSNEVSTDDESVDDSSQGESRASLWLKTHTIYYASVDECTSNVGTSGGSDGAWCLGGGNGGSNGGKKQKNYSNSSKNGNRSGSMSNSSSNGKPSTGRSTRNSEMLWADGIPPKTGNPLIEILDNGNSNGKNKTLSIQDPSIEVLLLLRALHSINCYWFTFYQVALPRPAIALQEFYSSKIHSKTSRQLQDPLGVMTGNLPNWLIEIGKSFPYLLPFEAKSLLFYVTSFDRDRAMLRLQESAATAEGATGNNSAAGMNSSQNEASDRVIPRLDRKKRVVTRATQVAESGAAGVMLKEAESILNEFGSSRIVLELQFRDEVGSGLGPTLEWYTLISHQLMRKDLEMWRSLDDDESHEYHISADNTIHESSKKTNVQYVKPNNGLFPRPFGRYVKGSLLNKVKSRFRLLGKFLARSLMDNRLVDLPLSIPFYKWMLGMENCLTAADLEHIDPALFRIYCRLQQLVVRKRQLEADLSLNPSSLQLALESLTLDNSTVESLDLTFELPGYNIEMKKGGKDAIVTIHNLEQYLDLLVYWTLHEGVSKQMEALREGFESVFPVDHLRFFFPEDLDELFCGAGKCEKWNAKDIADSTKVDHGFTHESQAVKWFFDIICQYGYSEQRLLLQFITGSPRLPVGGFRSLNPQLTVVRKTLSNPDESPDDFLPSVMTCVNYFKLPDYSTREIMAARLRQAIFEGQQSFDLS